MGWTRGRENGPEVRTGSRSAANADEQRQQIKQQTGKDAAAVEFRAEELEGRIDPASISFYAAP